MPYTPVKIDLTAVKQETTLFPSGTLIREAFILDIPVGATFNLKIGNNPFFKVSGVPTLTFAPRGRNDAFEGLYYSNATAQAGVTLEIVVVSGDDGSLSTVVP